MKNKKNFMMKEINIYYGGMIHTKQRKFQCSKKTPKIMNL
jgi:hypothetical protein